MSNSPLLNRLIERNQTYPILLPAMDAQQNLLEIVDVMDSRYGLTVLEEMLEQQLRFTEHSFLVVFMNSRRSGRTTVRQLQWVKKALSTPQGKRRYWLAIDHQWRWVCHCRLAETTQALLGRFDRLRCRRIGPLLIVDVLKERLEPTLQP